MKAVHQAARAILNDASMKIKREKTLPAEIFVEYAGRGFPRSYGFLADRFNRAAL